MAFRTAQKRNNVNGQEVKVIGVKFDQLKQSFVKDVNDFKQIHQEINKLE
jgi:hypothetical protein